MALGQLASWVTEEAMVWKLEIGPPWAILSTSNCILDYRSREQKILADTGDSLFVDFWGIGVLQSTSTKQR
jgi:hypothetical protein